MIIAIAWPISILLTAFIVWLATDSAAHQRGYKSGYDIGVAFGHKTGYQNGQLVGRQSGDAEGYERGRKDGIEAERALHDRPKTLAEKLAQAPKRPDGKKRGRGAPGRKP